MRASIVSVLATKTSGASEVAGAGGVDADYTAAALCELLTQERIVRRGGLEYDRARARQADGKLRDSLGRVRNALGNAGSRIEDIKPCF